MVWGTCQHAFTQHDSRMGRHLGRRKQWRFTQTHGFEEPVSHCFSLDFGGAHPWQRILAKGQADEEARRRPMSQKRLARWSRGIQYIAIRCNSHTSQDLEQFGPQKALLAAHSSRALSFQEDCRTCQEACAKEKASSLPWINSEVEAGTRTVLVKDGI